MRGFAFRKYSHHVSLTGPVAATRVALIVSPGTRKVSPEIQNQRWNPSHVRSQAHGFCVSVAETGILQRNLLYCKSKSNLSFWASSPSNRNRRRGCCCSPALLKHRTIREPRRARSASAYNTCTLIAQGACCLLKMDIGPQYPIRR